MLFASFKWLEHNSWIVAIDSTAVESAVLLIVHYCGFFLLVGSIAVVNLRLLGVGVPGPTAARLGKQIFPTMWTGLVLSLLSGFILFAGSATQYYNNQVFYLKVLIVLLAIVCTVIIQWNVSSWDRLPAVPVWAKWLAFVSIALWIGAILIGVEIPGLTGVG
jgi:uncharacterized membrane protein